MSDKRGFRPFVGKLRKAACDIRVLCCIEREIVYMQSLRWSVMKNKVLVCSIHLYVVLAYRK